MRKIYLFILFFSFTGFAFAQQSNKESLMQQIDNANEDTLKVNLLLELSDIYNKYSKLDSALLLAHQGLELAKTLDYKKGLIQGTQKIGGRSWRLGDFSKSIKYGYSLLEIAESLNDTSLMIISYRILTNSYRDQGDYHEALKMILKSNEIRKAYSGPNLTGINYAVVASIYYGLGKYDSASYYLKIALSRPEGFGYGWILLITGRTEAKLKNHEIAFDYYRQSITQLLKENNYKDLAGAYASIATLFDDVAQTDSAIFYGKQGVNLAKQENYNKELFEAYLILSKAYEKVSAEDALVYYKLAMDEKNNLFNQETQRQITSYKFNEILKQNEVEATQLDAKNKLKLNALLGSTFTLVVIAILLFRYSRMKQKSKQKIETAYDQLRSTQSQLIQSEKMASLGELTAGIAHEIQNPLNFVNNFSEVNNELIDELKDELNKGDIEEAKTISKDIKENEQKISHHGQRASGIVKGMLEHSRTGDGVKEPTDINALADEYLRLAYHGLRAKDKSPPAGEAGFHADFKTDFDQSLPKVNVVPQDIGRVLLNLINNAFYAVNEKNKTLRSAQSDGSYNYQALVTLSTKLSPSERGIKGLPAGQAGEELIEISVQDNGSGIPEQVQDKIFQPFFTTKPTGSGTGLGLSLSYDIVKAHGGELKVESEEGEGSVFIIHLPIV